MTSLPRIGLWRSFWNNEEGFADTRLEIVEGNLYAFAKEDGADGYAENGGAAYDAYQEVETEVTALRDKFACNMLAFGVEPRLQVAAKAVIEYMYEHGLTDWSNGLDDEKKKPLTFRFRPTGPACPYSRVLVEKVVEALDDYDAAMANKNGTQPPTDKERWAYAKTNTFAATNWARRIFTTAPSFSDLGSRVCVEPLDMHLGRTKDWDIKLLKARRKRAAPRLVAA